MKSLIVYSSILASAVMASPLGFGSRKVPQEPTKEPQQHQSPPRPHDVVSNEEKLTCIRGIRIVSYEYKGLVFRCSQAESKVREEKQEEEEDDEKKPAEEHGDEPIAEEEEQEKPLGKGMYKEKVQGPSAHTHHEKEKGVHSSMDTEWTRQDISCNNWRVDPPVDAHFYFSLRPSNMSLQLMHVEPVSERDTWISFMKDYVKSCRPEVEPSHMNFVAPKNPYGEWH